MRALLAPLHPLPRDKQKGSIFSKDLKPLFVFALIYKAKDLSNRCHRQKTNNKSVDSFNTLFPDALSGVTFYEFASFMTGSECFVSR